MALPLRELLMHDLELQFHHGMPSSGLVGVQHTPLRVESLRIDLHQEALVVCGCLLYPQPKPIRGCQHCVLPRNACNKAEDNNGDFYHCLYYHKLLSTFAQASRSISQDKKQNKCAFLLCCCWAGGSGCLSAIIYKVTVDMSEDIVCGRHKQMISFICTFENCASRKMCEQCKTRENLHFTQHANFVYRVKDFYDYSNSKDLIPRLEKGIQDSENYINSHKSFYHEQTRLLNSDFDILAEVFREVCENYKKIYVDAFEKEMAMFDEELMAIKALLKEYVYEKNQQESFFTRIFGNDSAEKQQIDDLVKKNTKVFKVRAAIISLRSKIAIAKTNKTAYKSSQTFQARFDELKDHFRQFTISFFDRLKELLSHEGSPTTLKTAIVSESRLLSGSQVGSESLLNGSNASLSGSQVSIASQPNILSGSVNLGTSRALSESPLNTSLSLQSRVRVTLPEPHPNVLKIITLLKPIEYPPHLPMLVSVINKNKRDQGPFKYSLGTYLGTYDGGVRSGKGIFIFSRDGSFYEGTWEDDNMWGYGRLITQNSYYEGEIANGVAHGQGTFENSVKVYSGEWRNDQRHGSGEEIFKTKRYRYKGIFASDKYQGQGVLEDEDSTYSGRFSEGLFDGEGVVRYKSGETFAGIFRAGERVAGRQQMPDGSFYEGQYEGEVPHGKGDFRWPDGVRYVGEWRGGVQDGEGVELREGREMRGLWKGGNWVRWI